MQKIQCLLLGLVLAAATLTLVACSASPEAPHYRQQDATTGSMLHSQYGAAIVQETSTSYTQPHIMNGHN
ncbi:hypothetical protein [Lichenicoccus sp.]|uniref:hypothetical protein n=1 Tax=Lichenicoccus sp. TaxID=2781899 RepID=UPI003D0DC2A9